jgi:myo-inositol 2-dehydrogenase / D-chiro-inositol 1-dehydrogenase
MNRVKVGIVGTGFVADIHAAALKMVPEAELIGVASPTPGKAKKFAAAARHPQRFRATIATCWRSKRST